jgi:hypothetical protein
MRIELIMPMPQSHPVMLNGAKRSEASKVDSSPTFGMNCDEKTKFQVLFKCSLTTRLCSQTELAVG